MRSDSDIWDSGHEPRAFRTDNRYEILRAEPGKKISLVCLSTVHYNAMCHYFGGRTVPCIKKECMPCTKFREKRWTGWVLGEQPETRKKRIVQFTERSAAPLIAIEKHRGNLRGVCFVISRTGKRKQSPVLIEIAPRIIAEEDLPAEDEILPILCAMFDVTFGQPIVQCDHPDDAELSRQAEELEMLRQSKNHDS